MPTFPGERSVCFTALWPVGLVFSCRKGGWSQGWLESAPSLNVDLVTLDRSFFSFLLLFWHRIKNLDLGGFIYSVSEFRGLCIQHLYFTCLFIRPLWFQTEFGTLCLIICFLLTKAPCRTSKGEILLPRSLIPWGVGFIENHCRNILINTQTRLF